MMRNEANQSVIRKSIPKKICSIENFKTHKRTIIHEHIHNIAIIVKAPHLLPIIMKKRNFSMTESKVILNLCCAKIHDKN